MRASQARGPGSNPGRGTVLYGDSDNELKGVITNGYVETIVNNLEISASDLLKFEIALRSKNIGEEIIKK